VTIVRIRGHFQLFLTLVTAVGDGFHGAIGIGVFTNEAFASGAAAIPGPLTDADYDGWMYHQFIDVHGITLTEADGSNAVVMVQAGEIDSKAMRIQEDSQTLLGLIEVGEEGTAAAEFWADTRVLDKLS